MSESKELSNWQEDLAKDAKKIAHNEGSDASAITIQHGMMMYQDNPVPNNTLEVIILANTTEHCLYTKPWDPEVINSPDCFSQSTESRGLVPHENVPEPIHPDCDSCPYNEFGSALTADGKAGKGKRCKEYRKIAMVHAGVTLEDIPKAEIVYLKISPTSLSNWRKYVQQLVQSSGFPPWAVKTEIKVVPDRRTVHQIQFKGIEPVDDNDMLAALHGRIPEAEDLLLRPYTYEDEEDSQAF